MVSPRLSLITLGVENLERSRSFYEALGWTASPASNEHVAFFQLNGMALSLYGRKALAEDAQLPAARSGFVGFSLAQNQASRQEVDRVLNEAIKAGGTLVKAAQEVFWGGYSGYFADPDAFLWEVAWNPAFPLDSKGNLSVPE
jgi:predicted lactoylglutathione lyase